MHLPPRFWRAQNRPRPVRDRCGRPTHKTRFPGALLFLAALPLWFPSCENSVPVAAGTIAGRVSSAYEAERHPDQRIVLYKTREQVLGPRKRSERNSRYLETGAKIVVRNLFRQADLLDEDQIRINHMSHAERLDRDVRGRFARPESPDSEFERRRQRLDGNTTNLKRVGGGDVGVTESLHLNYQKEIYDGKLDIRPKVDLDEVGVYAAWKKTF